GGTSLRRRLSHCGEVEQLQPRGPALGATCQLSELCRRKGLTIEITEEAFDLPGAKPQVLAADFQQRPGDTQPRQIETGQRPGTDQERDTRRRVVDEALQGELRWTVLQRVQVIDDEQGSPSLPGFEGVGGRLHRVPTVRDWTER